MLNILFSHFGIVDKDGFGRSFKLARELANFGHKVTFLTTQPHQDSALLKVNWRENVEILSVSDIGPTRLSKGGLGPLNICLRTFHSCFRQFDIVHSDSGHRPAAGIPCVVHRLLHGSKYVSEWWDFFGKGGIYDEMPIWYKLSLGLYDNWAETHNKKIADGVVALSHFSKDRALRLGIDENRIRVIPGGADVRSIPFYPITGNRKKFGLPEDAFILGFVGINEKEVEDLTPFFEVFRQLRKAHNIHLFTTGGCLSETTKKRCGLESNYHEFGWLTEDAFSELLSCAQCFLLLLRDNIQNKARWPNKIGDYVAAGRPVIISPVGELSMLVQKYADIFLPVDWSGASITTLLKSLLARKEELPKTFETCRKFAESEISWKIRARELESFYFDVLRT